MRLVKMHSYPSLSIIIPSYNQGSYIERTLLSILKQDYPGKVEVIVSDGGSQDQTVEILKKYPQVKWWSEPDKGFVDAVTKGFNAATGEIFAIQSSDDFYLKDALQLSISELKKDNEIAIISGCDIYLNPDMETFSVSSLKQGHVNPYQLLFGELGFPQHCTFFRSEILEKVGGLREELDTCADTDLWYRSLHFYNGKVIPYYTAVYQSHDNQRTRVLNSFYSSLTKMVESCEKDPTYSTKFKLSEEERENLYLRWDIFWSLYSNSTDKDLLKISEKIKNALVSDIYTKETKDALYNLAVSYGIFSPHRKNFLSKIIDSSRNGSLQEKIIEKIQSVLTTKIVEKDVSSSISIDWWKN